MTVMTPIRDKEAGPGRKFGFQVGTVRVTVDVSPATPSIDETLQQRYSQFFGALENTARLVVQYNYTDAMDAMDVPDDLRAQVDVFHELTWNMHKDVGVLAFNGFMERAKSQLYLLPAFKKLDAGQKEKLSEILREHLNYGIQNPPNRDVETKPYVPKKKQ